MIAIKKILYNFHNLPKWKIFSLLSAVTLLGMGLIFVFFAINPEQGRDAMLYIELIDKWHLGGFEKIIREWPEFWLPPLYFHLSHLVMYLGFSAEGAALAISMFCGICMPSIIFGISYEITQKINLSLCAALLIAVNPVLIELACCVQRDVPYLCFASLSMYFFIAGIRRKKWYFYPLSGIFCAWAFLIRYESIEFILLTFLYTAIALIWKHDKYYLLLRNLLLFLCGLTFSLAILLFSMDTSDTKMIKMYQKYFSDKLEFLESLYDPPPEKIKEIQNISPQQKSNQFPTGREEKK